MRFESARRAMSAAPGDESASALATWQAGPRGGVISGMVLAGERFSSAARGWLAARPGYRIRGIEFRAARLA